MTNYSKEAWDGKLPKGDGKNPDEDDKPFGGGIKPLTTAVLNQMYKDAKEFASVNKQFDSEFKPA